MRKKILILSGLISFLFVAFFAGVAVSEENVLLVGTITDNNQLIDNNGTKFEIQDSEQGKALSALVGKKAEVKGTVMENEGKQMITITSYKLIEEQPSEPEPVN